MPTVPRWNGYRFYFFSNEGQEPPHIHVDRGENTVKFWLDPVEIARNIGFAPRELNVIERKVQEERENFIKAWDVYFGSGC
ncbi:MAG: DUF4160 domain-containing protein [Alphaproteobacteria bacterium]|nr:DUF4160 domain-containing protein [Alphaproteobacteria bacterium]MDE2111589.1 DUF4160 domain-containing protein [Alphaproteobacteria bacterium]MDE2495739.1 DUF4160 domain-containing protein [Alphaproteobacteria bacterium]